MIRVLWGRRIDLRDLEMAAGLTIGVGARKRTPEELELEHQGLRAIARWKVR